MTTMDLETRRRDTDYSVALQTPVDVKVALESKNLQWLALHQHRSATGHVSMILWKY